jgi:hypothetical protein
MPRRNRNAKKFNHQGQIRQKGRRQNAAPLTPLSLHPKKRRV